jgi:G3E family GTPase
LRDRGATAEAGDDRRLVDLLVEQIEFADVVVLNKVSDVGPAQRDAGIGIIRALNPEARLILAEHARVPAAEIMGTGLFDIDRAQSHPLWAQELYGHAGHRPETEEYGIASFVYRARRPFDPGAVHAVLSGPLPGVIRAKGHFWLATRPDWVGEFSLAGVLSTMRPLGTWWAAVPPTRRPRDAEAQAYLARQWQEPWGDRRQEIVFIGSGMDRAAITAGLDAALLGDDRFRPSAWRDLADPFPVWRHDAA